MAARLFDRDFEINVDGKLIASRRINVQNATLERVPHLTVSFEVERSLKKQPNNIKLIIINLNEEHRAELQKLYVPLSIKAGYVDNMQEIFLGEVTYASTVPDGTDFITTLQAGDGAKAYASARINTSVAGPAKVSDVMKMAAEALGVGTGNVDQKLNGLRNVFKQFTQGAVLSGKAEKQLSKVLNPMGYDWSIQGGHLQVLGPDEYIGTAAYVLNAETGLYGSPEVGDKGLVSAKCALIPDLAPGRPLRLESAFVAGLFRIEEIKFVGNTSTTEWGANLSLKPVS